MEIWYSPKAKKDLDRIEDYISEVLQSPITALDNIDKIFDDIELLLENPFL